ncbi:acyl carrier protein [bacterium]|nr:acyl carrier protein [bacterium]
MELPATLIFDHPSIKDISTFLDVLINTKDYSISADDGIVY